MPKTLKRQPQPRLKCAFCEAHFPPWRRYKNGTYKPGAKLLLDHVLDSHPEQEQALRAALSRDYGDGNPDTYIWRTTLDAYRTFDNDDLVNEPTEAREERRSNRLPSRLRSRLAELNARKD